jgi:hypothetical protein
MALSAAILERINRYGRDKAKGHPDVEMWYTRAILNESVEAWGVLYDEAMAAKTAHLCLKFPHNSDLVARGLVASEPSTGTGARTYKYDFTDREWATSTPAGAAYTSMADEAAGAAGLSLSPLLCI